MKNKMTVIGQGFAHPEIRSGNILNVISELIYFIDITVKYNGLERGDLSLKGLSQYICKLTQNNVFMLYVRFCGYLQINLVKLFRVVATALN